MNPSPHVIIGIQNWLCTSLLTWLLQTTWIVFPNVIDSFQLIKDSIPYEQPLPLNLSVPNFDSSLLHEPTNPKNFMHDYIKNKEIFNLKERLYLQLNH